MFLELKEKAGPGTVPVSHSSLGFQVLLLTPPSDISPAGPGEHSLLGKRHTSVVHSCFQAAEGFQIDQEGLGIPVFEASSVFMKEAGRGGERRGRGPGEGNGTPLQYSCLGNPMDRGAWWATVHRVAKNRTRLSDFTSLKVVAGLIFYPNP